MLFPSLLESQMQSTRYRSHRSSSWDRSGANSDFRRIPAGERLTIFEARCRGIITHIWFALAHTDPNYMRKLVIQAWWDEEKTPSVNCPLGDFFGVGHAITNSYSSIMMNMVRGEGRRGESTGCNCYIPMPFANAAKIDVLNESEVPCWACYYHIDWLEVLDSKSLDGGRFHAQWRRENPCKVRKPEAIGFVEHARFGANLDGTQNYEVLNAVGAGQFLGMNLSIDNLDDKCLGQEIHPFGEGDEMMFIDGEVWPPSLHGTGTEDYFSDAWGMTGKAGLYTGTSYEEKDAVKKGRREKGTCYRFHIADPVYFSKSFRFSIEHGHANHQSNDISSTAYWYQIEPHIEFDLPEVTQRIPLRDTGDPNPDEERKVIAEAGKLIDRYQDIQLNGTREQVRNLEKKYGITPIIKALEIRDAFLTGKISADDAIKQIIANNPNL